MPSLNILNLNQGDSQQDIIRKVNANFDSIVASGGGPRGPKGDTGEQGPVGAAGPKGDPGQQGTRGTRWFVQSTQPTGGTSDPILVGDYWVDTADSNTIYQYGSSGWVDTNEDLQATEVFELIQGISGPTGNKNAIVFSTSFPEVNTLVLSDSISTQSTANPTYSKLLISTNGNNDYPLLEFAKTNSPGIGTPSDYNRHPQFRWLTPSGSSYDLLFTVPQDGLTLRSGGNLNLTSTSSNVSIFSNSNFSLDAGSNVNITSLGSMSISSGSAGANSLSISSSNLILTPSDFSTTARFTVTNSSTGYGMSVLNTSTGGGLKVQVNSTSTSLYAADFWSVSSRIFGVRNDGRTEVRKMVNGFTSFTGTTSNVWGTVTSGSIWRIGSEELINGNVIIVDLTPASGNRYLSIPSGGATSSWGNYLANNTSITFRILAVNDTKTIKGLSKDSGTPSGAADVTFPTATVSIDITVVKQTTSTVTVYYSTCNGYCGIL